MDDEFYEDEEEAKRIEDEFLDVKEELIRKETQVYFWQWLWLAEHL